MALASTELPESLHTTRGFAKDLTKNDSNEYEQKFRKNDRAQYVPTPYGPDPIVTIIDCRSIEGGGWEYQAEDDDKNPVKQGKNGEPEWIPEDDLRKIEQAARKIEPAETKIEPAETKIEQTETKVEQAETKIEQTETKVEQAETKVEQAETKVEQAETKVEQAKTKIEPAAGN
ncbi:MAG: hypothetical protein M1821_002519 [Bathelium mastoideum]|nr:MAG: hypothetical protein M1821_002519 [Bathelium mastoideum]